jgi:hypothetical protein
MTNYETGTIIIILPVKMIANSICQRKIDTRKVRNMSKNWDWIQYDPITVNKISCGKNIIFRCTDGQHRLNAAREAGIEKLTCKQITVLEIEEPKYFIKSNNNRKKQSIYSVYMNGLMAGERSMVVIDRILSKHDARITEHGSTLRDINCPGALMTLQRIDPDFENIFDTTLGFIIATWPQNQKAFLELIIISIYKFLKNALNNPRFSIGQFEHRLSLRRIENLIADLPKNFKTDNSAVTFYSAIYNFGRGAKSRINFLENTKEA